MPDNEPQPKREYRVRASLPKYFRIAAIAAIGVTLLAIVAGFYNARSKSPFRLKSEHAQLSTDVVSEISGYERLETENGVTKYYIKADHAKTFSDNHQELQNVYIEVFDKEGAQNDKMAAESAIYIPEPEKNFTAYLKGNVRIDTYQGLKVKTDHITYTRKTEIAEADEAVEFERENIRGKSFGAIVKIADKRIELLQDVDIELFESPELARANVRYGRVTANSAVFDQRSQKISAHQNVAINIVSTAKETGKQQTTDIAGNRAELNLAGENTSTAQLKTVEFFDNVRITSVEQGSLPTNIESGYALYDKSADRFELKNGAHIVTAAGERPTDLRASEAIYEQTARKVALTGGAEIVQGSDTLKGDVLFATLFADNKVKDAVIRGNASARQVTAERTTTISAPELNATFDEARHMRDANAIGQSNVELIPAISQDYSRVTAAATRGIGLIFKGEGLLESMRTDGRTTINLNAPNSSPDAANKRLTADKVTSYFHQNGKDMRRAEAVGNAELFVDPLNAGKDSYRTTIDAPRFDCEFFPTGNNAKTCIAGKRAKAVRVPTVQDAKRGHQTLTADQLTAHFSPRSNDIETFDAAGSAKFNELDRNAIARQMTFTQADQILRLRGAEPTAWDSSARAKAAEIDWDTRNARSYLRGGVSTTYYSRKQMRDSAPFGSSEKPVFITADNAEFDHNTETANYTGNARGWQDANYVRGNRIYLDQRAGKLLAEGSVQTALYNARVMQKGKQANVPTYAAATTMTYERDKRLLQYRTAVDIRQGTDRITADSADVYLDEKNELSRTVAESNVVITQPHRKATGDWAEYAAGEETAILRGSPATVSDAESGSSQSPQLTFYMRENRVVSAQLPKQATPGRSRSVYKVKPNP